MRTFEADPARDPPNRNAPLAAREGTKSGQANDMTKPSDSTESVVPAEVRELIVESQTIQGWIARLASHADDARPEVFERVRDDYQGRLDSVNGKLARHRTDLVERLDGRRSEVEALRSDRDSHAAELEEARLRHAVGEYSDKRWDERRGGIEESLGELDALLEVEEGAVAELSGIIASIGEGGTPGAVDSEPEIVVEGVDVGFAPAEALPEEAADDSAAAEDEEEDASSAVAVEGDSEDEAGEADGDEGDEAEIAASAVTAGSGDAPADETATTTADEPATATADAGEIGGEAGEEEGGEYLDELEFLESLSLDEADRFDAVSAMLDEEENQES